MLGSGHERIPGGLGRNYHAWVHGYQNRTIYGTNRTYLTIRIVLVAKRFISQIITYHSIQGRIVRFDSNRYESYDSYDFFMDGSLNTPTTVLVLLLGFFCIEKVFSLVAVKKPCKD